jgi:hypothetical protein
MADNKKKREKLKQEDLELAKSLEEVAIQEL